MFPFLWKLRCEIELRFRVLGCFQFGMSNNGVLGFVSWGCRRLCEFNLESQGSSLGFQAMVWGYRRFPGFTREKTLSWLFFQLEGKTTYHHPLRNFHNSVYHLVVNHVELKIDFLYVLALLKHFDLLLLPHRSPSFSRNDYRALGRSGSEELGYFLLTVKNMSLGQWSVSEFLCDRTPNL